MSILTASAATQDGPKLIRPAVIELRFSNKKQYIRHVRAYRRALGITKPFNPPKPPTPYSQADSSFSCQVGMIPKGWKDPDMQLRFVLLAKKKIGKNRTVIYWEVKKPNLPSVTDTFTNKLGYRVVDPPHSTVTPPSPDSIQTILSLTDSKEDTSSTSFAAEALTAAAIKDGNNVGLVINPPYPRYTDGSGGPGIPAIPSGFSLLSLGLTLLVGLLAGWGFTRLYLRARR
ncbi:hypothetical protein FNT36_11545 [Hymenobacter setariae]|uniref:Uncharacterized protein n=1 Tax=Hymenobacter setariae TaxID=2594794 RepID=A0A558BUD1_9BACT|nr:hypothetical protein [Hymenobacter setariae]TVT40126.1 hypothetical protein FNT36_11545 [Hymenobacter setariae]